MPHANQEDRRAYMRQWKAKNKGRYDGRDKAYAAARHANKRAARQGVSGTVTADEVQSVLERESCHWCGRTGMTGPDRVVDHIIPLAKSGPNTVVNLALSCWGCNSRKSFKSGVRSWARDHEQCASCGTTDRRHTAHGLCARCHRIARRLGIEKSPKDFHRVKAELA